MEIFTDLTASDFLAVQVRSIHALRGTYYHPYHETRMDTRTIIDITPKDGDSGHFTMHCSDGSTDTVADFIRASDAGENTVRVEVRAADGSGSGDGPVLTPEIRAKFVALGVDAATIPEVTAPLVIPPAATSPASPEAPDALTESSTTDEVVKAEATAAPALTLTTEQHAASKSLADEIEAHIPDAVKEAWAKLRALLHHL
jgi:hypothetical protein